MTLYQTELRSLPTKRAYLTGIPQQCKPSFCSFCSSRRFFGDLSLPVATDPNVPVSTLGPLAGDPDGVWPRKRGPTALKPNPISLPGPVTGHPGIGIFRHGRHPPKLLRRRRGSLMDDSRAGLCAGRQRVLDSAVRLNATGNQRQSSSQQCWDGQSRFVHSVRLLTPKRRFCSL